MLKGCLVICKEDEVKSCIPKLYIPNGSLDDVPVAPCLFNNKPWVNVLSYDLSIVSYRGGQAVED